MKIIEAKAISMAEAKEIVLKREKDKELGYEQKLALEHLNAFTKLKLAETNKLMEEINSIVKMGETTLAQIVNLMPKTPDELRLIFAREKFSLKEDEVKRILEVIKKYL